MKTSELIKNYTKATGKYDFTKHLTTTYVPYLEKLKKMTAIVNISCYKKVQDKKVYYRDTPCMIFTFTMKMLEMYTDIEFGNVIEDYDALESAGILSQLMGIIPESEYNACYKTLELIQADIEFNEREIVPFLETKLDAMEIGTQAVLDELGSLITTVLPQTK